MIQKQNSYIIDQKCDNFTFHGHVNQKIWQLCESNNTSGLTHLTLTYWQAARRMQRWRVLSHERNLLWTPWCLPLFCCHGHLFCCYGEQHPCDPPSVSDYMWLPLLQRRGLNSTENTTIMLGESVSKPSCSVAMFSFSLLGLIFQLLFSLSSMEVIWISTALSLYFLSPKFIENVYSNVEDPSDNGIILCGYLIL